MNREVRVFLKLMIKSSYRINFPPQLVSSKMSTKKGKMNGTPVTMSKGRKLRLAKKSKLDTFRTHSHQRPQVQSISVTHEPPPHTHTHLKRSQATPKC